MGDASRRDAEVGDHAEKNQPAGMRDLAGRIDRLDQAEGVDLGQAGPDLGGRVVKTNPMAASVPVSILFTGSGAGFAPAAVPATFASCASDSI